MILNRIPILFDGAMGTELQVNGIPADDKVLARGCNEAFNISHPEIIARVHRDYLSAGATIIETNTFGGTRIKLAEYGLADKTAAINSAAARLACEAAASFKTVRPVFVAGSMGPSGALLSSPKAGTLTLEFDECRDIFREQAEALIEGGVDVLLCETMQDLLELRAAILGAKDAMARCKRTVPIIAQVTMDANGYMLLGSDVKAFLGAVSGLAPTVMGFNCSTGPKEMMPIAEELLASAPCAVSLQPNAGMPENVNGHAKYCMTPHDFAETLSSLVIDKGVSIAGGCCGTTPAHIAALAKRLEGKKVGQRKMAEPSAFLGTGISGVSLDSIPRPVIIGERINAQGSKKTKELILAKNWDELASVADEQVAKGATVLDLCVAINERDDEVETIVALTEFLRERQRTPFCIDSTDPAVFEAALRKIPGAALVNSINFEKNGDKARRILSYVKEFGCPVIALPIDDKGMARTVDDKMAFAHRFCRLLKDEFGIPESYLYFDPLVFTLATGEAETADAAVLALETLRRLKKEIPLCKTAMGVSNVSFGLKPAARRILNNLMLHHAVEAGLDAAIFNPLHLDDVSTYDPKVRAVAEDLLFNRRKEALVEYIELFPSTVEEKKSAKPVSKESLPPAARLQQAVLNRDRRGIDTIIAELLKQQSATSILDELLLPAMKNVGEQMARGEMILPFVLQAAEVMKECLTILDPYFDKDEAGKKGTIIMATVFGDIHDIGKNLVVSIMKNQGFHVIDLGKQVPLADVISAIEKEKPTAVGLSALLVTTSREMAECVKECDARGLTVPIIIGGAAVNRAFAERIAIVGDGRRYAGGVYHGRDAFDAARIIDSIKNGTMTQPKPVVTVVPTAKNALAADVTPEPLEYGGYLEPHFWGTGEVLQWDSEKIIKSIDREELFRGYWRGGNFTGEKYKETVRTEFEPVFATIAEEIIKDDLLDGRGLYGYFPVITQDDVLHVQSPSNPAKTLASFTFPRVLKARNRSIADFFRPEGDVIALQAVTIGEALSKKCRHYFEKEDKYSLGFYLNGLGNYVTELLADWVTREVRRGLGVAADAGKRFSFGYTGTPQLEEQLTLLDLICADDRLGITLTTGFQMNPEHSTAGFFVSHDKAEYF
jgi:5-methyltetrahydrofolate--homocysteine methyltransferase